MFAATARVEQPPGIQPFLDGHEHLLAELERLKLMLHGEVLRMRSENLLTENQFRGLYVADEQVDAILHDSAPQTASSNEESPDLRAMRTVAVRVAEYERGIAAQCAASVAAGLVLPLVRLTEIFSLSGIESDALLLSVAPEIDVRFETLCSYAQNDVTRKRPTAGLILRLVGTSATERLRLRALFSAKGRLLSIPLVRFSDEAAERDSSLLSRAVKPEERIIDYLLEQAEFDARLRSFTKFVEPTRPLASLYFPGELVANLRQAASALREKGGILFFHGDAGAGKCAAANALSAEAGRRLVVADARRIPSAGAPATLGLLQREARLREANLLLTHSEAWLGEDNGQRHLPQTLCESLAGSMVSCDRVLFVASESQWPVAESAMNCAWAQFEFPVPGFPDRVRLWEETIEAAGANAQSGMAAALANQFVLTGGQILGAGRMVKTHAILRGRNGSALTRANFEAAARAQSNQALRRRAQKIDAVHEWRDLVLPPRTLQQLREVCAAEKYRSQIFTEWGFDRRLLQGKGLNVLFCGQSGTGKTMSAGIVARELGLDLYKIDLSSVVSKYIGETEKHLNQIFHEAQSSNAILFFDEADAIFGKRSEVKDAHDRYANIEVAYLLQKMEEYEGIVILATNFRKNIDDAFTRRIHYIVEFPFPETQYRERIWRSLVPASAPLNEDVDFGFLARQFELTGGNIRNVALVAALLAAEEGGKICMEHFVLATARELQKMGKLPSRSDFREYYELTRERI
jgi:AAA+ superfamily predicted ATPase